MNTLLNCLARTGAFFVRMCLSRCYAGLGVVELRLGSELV